MDSNRGWRRSSAGAFTLVDVLVSIAVIAVLISLLLPSLSMVRESTRRIVCASNLRQIGIGIHLYAQSERDEIPYSRFTDPRSNSYAPFETSRIRVVQAPRGALPDHTVNQDQSVAAGPVIWDGIGLLYAGEQINAPEVFYCPSHPGETRPDSFAERYYAGSGEIISNYEYRGRGPLGQTRLSDLATDRSLVSDHFSSADRLNHERGINVLQTAASVAWVQQDPSALVESADAAALIQSPGQGSPGGTAEPWDIIDDRHQDREGTRQPRPGDSDSQDSGFGRPNGQRGSWRF